MLENGARMSLKEFLIANYRVIEIVPTNERLFSVQCVCSLVQERTRQLITGLILPLVIPKRNLSRVELFRKTAAKSHTKLQ
jgi:hypothetical protein